MSQTDAIGNELRSMRAGIERARSTASATGREAEQVATRAAAAGFSGIVAGMSQVREAIRNIQAGLGSVDGAVNDASNSLVVVPKEASPAEVIEALNRAADRVGTAHDGVGSSLSKVDETRALVARVLQGGDPGPLLSMLGTIKEILLLVAQHGGAVKHSLASAVTDARRTGNSGN
ncbi:DUF6244 family protein [Plantactinospora sp. KLBMP9567]|uniref:DUF6244 family protein n=1 Tax=Plantactinospora sp. KLBMP9567 TaxID=3085900 RepID=UPI0029826628|nr:DUF6244 family protein [Plantactinospora sp. KLBMP9567]MDW5327526.1 DUF6244 family protein [Plantactinospora sp. KLBMP9567]